MASVAKQYRDLVAEMEALNNRIKAMESSPELKRDLEFAEKLQALLDESGYSLKNVIAILDPQGVAGLSSGGDKGSRAKRRTKRYTNPETLEVLETKGGNNAVLKAWKLQFGAETVEGWSTYID